MTILLTQRLRLEPFDHHHLDGLNAIHSDPGVMRYVGGQIETREQTAQVIERVRRRWAEIGYSWWAFCSLNSDEILGAGCIQNLRRAGSEPDRDCPLEIGWRIRRDHWRRGLAIEAARSMMQFAFAELAAPSLYAVCEPPNTASLNLMLRLGMRYRGLEEWYAREVACCEISREEWMRHSPHPSRTP